MTNLRDRVPNLRSFAWDYRVQLLSLLLFLVVEKTFYPCMSNDFANYDDQFYVYQNSHVLSGLSVRNIVWAFSSVTAANWHPITMLSHMLDVQLFGLHPWGHHLTSLLLHCCNCVLLFLLLQRATGALWESFFVALFFGIHPLRVESVAWVSERKDVLSTCFGLLCMFSFVLYAKAAPPKSRRYYWTALAFFLLGLMSKPMLVTFPFLLLLLDFWPLQRISSKPLTHLIKEKIPFLLLALGISGITCLTQTTAMYPMSAMPLGVRLANVPVAYCRYLAKTFYPLDLAAFYPYPLHWPANRIFGSLLILVLLSVGIAFLRRTKPFLVVGWLWFLGGLIPVIGILQVGNQSMADRYSYIPSIGLIVMIVWSGSQLARWRPRVSPTILTSACSASCACMLLTRTQSSYWKNGETLWRHAAAVTENNYVAYTLIGLREIEQTNYDAAIADLERALAINNDVLKAQVGLGMALNRTGNFEAAIQPLEKAISLENTNVLAHKELATSLAAKGMRKEALTNLLYALALQPGYSDAKDALAKLTNSIASR